MPCALLHNPRQGAELLLQQLLERDAEHARRLRLGAAAAAGGGGGLCRCGATVVPRPTARSVRLARHRRVDDAAHHVLALALGLAHARVVKDLEAARIREHPRAVCALLRRDRILRQVEHPQALQAAEDGHRTLQLARLRLPAELVGGGVERLQPGAVLQLVPAVADLVAADIEHLEERKLLERRQLAQLVVAHVEPREPMHGEVHARA